MTECWDRPLTLVKRYRRDRSSQRFVRVLLTVYAALFLLQLTAFIRWLPDMLEEIAVHGAASLTGPAVVMAFFLLAAAAAHIVARRHTQ